MACGKQPAGRPGVGSSERIDPQTGHRSALPRYARFRVETACPIVGADSSARPNFSWRKVPADRISESIQR